MSKPYAEVIGDPIAHSKSPLIHNFWLKKLGIDAEYRATRVTRDDLPAYLAVRRTDPAWRGCNVTMPLKRDVASLLDSREISVDRVDACNTVTIRDGTLVGFNTDVEGVLAALPAYVFTPCPPLPEACVIGMGGAARAAIEAFRRLNLSLLFLNVRDQEAGSRLLRTLQVGGSVGPLDDAHNLQTPHLVVNATPLGMIGFPEMPDGVVDAIRSGDDDEITVFDMVYSPVETRLLATARARGLRTVDGLSMLIGQAAASFTRLFGQSPSREHGVELRALLT